AIIAITLVMTAVFIPVTFMPGAVGVFYRQFGLTMAMSIVLSGVVALTLTPVLCAMILKPHTNRAAERGLIPWLNRGIKAIGGRNSKILRGILVVLLGLAAAYGIYKLLHVQLVHELISEQIALTETREIIIGVIMAVLFLLTFRSMFSGSEPGEVKLRG